MPISPASSRPFPAYKFPALTEYANLHDIPYKFGGKWDLKDPEMYLGNGIDCSGWIDWATYRASLSPEVKGTKGYPFNWPDGSWAMHQWAKANLKPCKYDDAFKSDGIIRFAYLSAKYDSKGRMIQAAHVMLIEGGYTFESRSGAGPSRVKWGSRGFHKLCRVYEFGVIKK